MGISSRLLLLRPRPVAGALLLWGLSLITSLAEDGLAVTVVVARQAEVTERIPVVGTLAPREEIQVYSLLQDQPIERILVEAGQYVARGQPLAILDTTDALMRSEEHTSEFQ